MRKNSAIGKLDHSLPLSSLVDVIMNSAALTVAKFDPSGKYIFVGTSQGTILVFNTRTKTVCILFLTSSHECSDLCSSSSLLDTGSRARAL